MIGNLTGKQILLIIVGIIILLWLIGWLASSNSIRKHKLHAATINNQALALAGQQNYQRLMQMQMQQQAQQAQQAQYTQHTQHTQHTQSVQSQPLQPSGLESQPPQDTPFILYYFYDPKCPHCIQFSPTWNEVSNKLRGVQGISIRAVDTSKPENENLAFYYNIKANPTVILVTPDQNIEYQGDRTEDDLYKFIVSNINNYANAHHN